MRKPLITEVYGIKYQLPFQPKPSSVVNYNKTKAAQKFERTPLPESFNDIEFDEDENAIYTHTQVEFIKQEFKRIKEGYWFYNNGELTYITGVHYFYLNYWTLEDGNIPDYRDTDRRWFYFQDYCEKDPNCYGIIRIKKRREGATSQAACTLLYTAITKPKSNCGIISKTGQPDAKDVFQKMVMRGYRGLPEFLKPRAEDEDPKSVLAFRSKKNKAKKSGKVRGQVYSNDIGLESVIDWRNTALNSYDSGRITIILIDEGGKFPKDVPINSYWPIVKKTLSKGAIKVGFALMPSTVNDAKGGGTEFQLIWDGSDHTKGSTATGLYRYFMPAYEGYEGFIDEYGKSILSAPTDRQKKYVKEKFGIEITTGAKEYLEEQRKIISNQKDSKTLSEEIRMNPFTEAEAFMIDPKRCYFNEAKIYEQLEFLDSNHIPLRRGRFIWLQDKRVRFEDDPVGGWLVYEFPQLINQNLSVFRDGARYPANTDVYASGIDPFRSSVISGTGSMGTCVISKRLNPADPNNTGMPVALYVGRPKMKSLFHDEMLKACVFYGCKATYENDVGDDFVDYFKDKGYKNWLSKTPEAAIDKLKKKNNVMTYGVASRDPFALARQLETMINYIELHCSKIYFPELLKELLIYDHDDRTSFDRTVAFMISLLSIVSVEKKVESSSNRPFIRTFELRVE